jgi:hypothetical protein
MIGPDSDRMFFFFTGRTMPLLKGDILWKGRILWISR